MEKYVAAEAVAESIIMAANVVIIALFVAFFLMVSL
jgi:hypothetical protein